MKDQADTDRLAEWRHGLGTGAGAVAVKLGVGMGPFTVATARTLSGRAPAAPQPGIFLLVAASPVGSYLRLVATDRGHPAPPPSLLGLDGA